MCRTSSGKKALTNAADNIEAGTLLTRKVGQISDLPTRTFADFCHRQIVLPGHKTSGFQVYRVGWISRVPGGA
jgi:hypothetical protein